MKKKEISIKSLTDSSETHLSNILSEKDLKDYKNLIPELQENWKKRQMFRTETEMRFSVLNDGRHPTKASKYWQSVREQNTHFENLMRASFEYRRNEIEIKKLKSKISKEKDVFEKELMQIDVEEKIYLRANLLLQAKHRIREITTWSKLKKELNDGSFDNQEVNTHQQESYLKQYLFQRGNLNEHSNQGDVFNTISQLETLKRLQKEKAIAQEKAKKIK